MTTAVPNLNLSYTNNPDGENFWHRLSEDFAFEGIDNIELERQLRLTTETWLNCGQALIGQPNRLTLMAQASADSSKTEDYVSVRPNSAAKSSLQATASFAQQATVEVAISTAWQITRSQLQRYLQNPNFAPLCVQVFGPVSTANRSHLIQQLINESEWPELVVQHHRRRHPVVIYDATRKILSISQNFVTQYAKTPALIARDLLAGLGQFVEAHSAEVQAA